MMDNSTFSRAMRVLLPSARPGGGETLERLKESAKKEKLRQAIVRGWCHKENEKKEMDVELAEAILKEVLEFLDEY